MKCERSMSEQLESLERQGLSLFVGCYASKWTFEDGKPICLKISVLLVTRCDDSRIKKQPDGTECIRAAIPRKPSGKKKPGESRARSGDGDTPKEPSTTPVHQFTFRQAGAVCDIVFDGSTVFHLNITDGVKYLDYLLHHPNRPIRAFDLELMVKPEKATVRSDNSIQTTVDARTKREARRELVQLTAELEEAEAEGNTVKEERLKGEIAKVQAVVGNAILLGGDTGERARDNVRKAIQKVVKNLRKGGKTEQAFGQHITRFISLGHEVAYNQPERMNWG